MLTFEADVQSRVLALVKTILERNAVVGKILPDSRLAGIGMASVDMVNLMFGVEAEFDVTIPQHEITPENFQSIESIERMVVKQLKADKVA